MNAPFRKMARAAHADVNEFEYALVSVKDGTSVLAFIEDHRLIVREDEPIIPMEPHPGVHDIRKAFWKLRGRAEWKDETGVVWMAPYEDGYQMGLGRMLALDAKIPVAVPVTVIGADDGA